VCDVLRQNIVDGQLLQGHRLPPSRSLAIELGVSRTTVVIAYDQLAAEGYIEGRRGSGFFVCPIGQIELNRGNRPVTRESPATILPQSRKQVHPGFPDLRLFPYRQWARCMSRVARLTPEALVVAGDSFGDIQLRQSIARYLRDWRGLNTSAEQILITAGSIDALEICVRTLAGSGQYVGLENPGYQPLRNIVQSLGMKPVWLSMGDHGLEVPSLKKSQPSPSMTILTPSHQFPLGGAMSPLRRTEFLQWAVETNSWIIEDDYDSEFRYAGSPIQALAGFDSTGRTIYIGTFSKIFSVGLRLGFLVAPPALIPRFAKTLERFGVKAATASQRALASFMDSGEFYRHIRRVRRIYGERRKFLLNTLQEKLDDIVSFEDYAAGMQLLARLPASYDDQAIAEAASRKGVITAALSAHYAKGEIQHGLLLGFCGFTEEEIESNISIIEKIIRSKY
jgi:GntR family transcriptional regulator/MocR family aminotransferase